LGSDHHGVPCPVDGAELLRGLEAMVNAMEEPMSGQFALPLFSLTRSASRLAHTFFNGLGAGLFGLFSFARFDDSRRSLFDYVPRPYDPDGIRLILPVRDEGREDFTEIVTAHLSSHRFDRKVSSWLLGNLCRHILGIGCALAQSMGAEALYPFLDDDVVLFSFSVPDELKVNEERIKLLLYALLDRYVPRDFLSKGKRGYWAHGGESAEAQGVLGWCYETGTLGPALDLLSEQRSLERGIYNRANLEKLLHKYRSREVQAGWHRILWQILAFEIFCRRFLDAQAAQERGV
jgi:asparagine synthetase B (glutamine-hydrolysing)